MQAAKKGDRVELRVLDLAEGGASFARMESGMSVFVDGLLVPGDQVLAELTQVKKRQARGRFLELVEPSPERVEAPCPLFTSCGGCRWQQLPYERELELKQKLVHDALQRIGRIETPNLLPIVPSPNCYRYRNKVEFVFSDAGYDLALGLHHVGDPAQVLQVADCLLVPEAWSRLTAKVHHWARESGLRVYDPESRTGSLRSLVLRQSQYTGECMVVLVTGNTEADRDAFAEALQGETLHTVVHAVAPGFNRSRYEDVQVLQGPGTITEKFNGLSFRVSPAAFLQPNTLQAEQVYAQALEWAELGGSSRVLDLYCGIGTLSLLAARQAKHVCGLEVVPAAIEDARCNAEANSAGNVTFSVANLGGKGRCEWPGADVVFVDPPRSGMLPSVVEALRNLKPERIVYVSCKPSSLARDVKALCEGGTYQLVSCQPFDQFPRTEHVEAVALLVRS